MNRRYSMGCGLTKTEHLRQTKANAKLREIEKKQEAMERLRADPFSVRKRILPPDPKKVDFLKPGMTKALMARVKHAEQFKKALEVKQQEAQRRQPRRTPAPIGGDARVGRERPKSMDRRRARTPGPSPTRYSPVRMTSPPSCRPYTPATTPKTPKLAKTPSRRMPKSTEKSISNKTNELAKAMNADIIQAEPVGAGPITNVVIPPGVVNDKRTTIVSIPQHTSSAGTSGAADRSLKLISKSLCEQDAAESETIQTKLIDLQEARRDLVLTVAGVGNKSVNLMDEQFPAEWRLPSPPKREKHVYRLPPDLDDDYLRLEHGIDHPDVVAAREFIKKMAAQREARDVARRLDEEFDRIAADPMEGLDLDVPLEEEMYLEKDISWEEDEGGMAMPVPSRVKTYTEQIPAGGSYTHDPFDPEELERFFDLERYPPVFECDPCSRMPAAREGLHPDLQELDDPWYRTPPCPAMEAPDLIEFDLIDFD